MELTDREYKVLEQIYHEMSKPTKTEFQSKWIAKQLDTNVHGMSPIIGSLHEKGFIETVKEANRNNAWTADPEYLAEVLEHGEKQTC